METREKKTTKIEIRKIKTQTHFLRKPNKFLSFHISNFCHKLFLLSLLSFSFLNAKENVPVPLDHWSYPILEYFATGGILKINLETKPVTREEVRFALEELYSI